MFAKRFKRNERVLLFITIALSACTDPTSLSNVLNSAESLMNTQPDSSWTLIRKINSDKIRQKKNYALYALLYTQAQYKNRIHIESDSLIDIAVSYYSSTDKLKYTNALMHKGAALQDMGVAREAITYFKQAEEQLLGSEEYLTLGLINTRIGELYQTMFIENNEHINKYKQALHYFQLANHQQNIHLTSSILGQLYRINNQDSAYHYIEQALELSTQLNDSSRILYNKILLATTYCLDKEYKRAKDLSLWVIQNKGDYKIKNEVYYCLVDSYANLGQTDSAIIYAKAVHNHNIYDSLSYYMTMCEIEKSRNDFSKALVYNEQSHHIGDSILKKAHEMDLYQIEKRYDHQQLLHQNQKLQSNIQINRYILLIVILVAIFLATSIRYLCVRKKKLIEENISFVEQIKSEAQHYTNTLIEKLDQKNYNENKLKEALEKRLGTIRQLIDLSYRYGTSPTVFTSKFNDIMKINKLGEGALNDLQEIVNLKYSGIIDHIKQQYPSLPDDDLQLLCMLCCKFSATEMSIFFNHKNEKSIYSRKNRLAVKMRLKTSLEEFIATTINQFNEQSDR